MYIFYRDETLEALGDANTVAPATKTADLHSQSHRNSYLYVFDYQTKFGDYPQVIFALLLKILRYILYDFYPFDILLFNHRNLFMPKYIVQF